VSDFVIVCLPLSPETRHLIDSDAIYSMKRGAYLVNTGRGSVVDEQAVVKALESEHLAGYAADVFEMEDWARSDRPTSIPTKLLNMSDRTLFTPHLGSAVDEVRKEIAMEAARNLVQGVNGKIPAGAANRPAGSNNKLNDLALSK
jgi:phosphonate dehydrogenase